jgi:hypothetical protein
LVPGPLLANRNDEQIGLIKTAEEVLRHEIGMGRAVAFVGNKRHRQVVVIQVRAEVMHAEIPGGPEDGLGERPT